MRQMLVSLGVSPAQAIGPICCVEATAREALVSAATRGG
eukprot:CAMPEP_0168461122 /NCGR_PEP_ID=MMETSP0228-20121227/53811_1 /TAXON_ID=133427 /ORGANISM="Protoceratium reticulatum, Strain CCCM 535 (=CCMP 1889)" /LENGTH=38 /DNA_ID= /DNA_START= /DNA_END= /DNA_ORIENTATION=